MTTGWVVSCRAIVDGIRAGYCGLFGHRWVRLIADAAAGDGLRRWLRGENRIVLRDR